MSWNNDCVSWSSVSKVSKVPFCLFVCLFVSVNLDDDGIVYTYIQDAINSNKTES